MRKFCGMGQNSWHAEVFAAVWAKALVGSSPATAIVAAKQSDHYSADIGINTAAGPTCFVPELVAGCASITDLSSAPEFFTADSLQCVSTQPATVVMQYS